MRTCSPSDIRRFRGRSVDVWSTAKSGRLPCLSTRDSPKWCRTQRCVACGDVLTRSAVADSLCSARMGRGHSHCAHPPRPNGNRLPALRGIRSSVDTWRPRSRARCCWRRTEAPDSRCALHQPPQARHGCCGPTRTLLGAGASTRGMGPSNPLRTPRRHAVRPTAA